MRAIVRYPNGGKRRVFTRRHPLAVVLFMTVLCMVFADHTSASYEENARPFLQQYCFSCHGPEKQKSKVRFDQFTGLTLDDAELWRLAKESIEFEEMPPKDAPQPTIQQREAFLAWLDTALNDEKLAADAHEAIHNPAEGNRVDHEQLFDGSIKGPAWSPPRVWRRSQSQYDALMEELWVIPMLRNDYAMQRDDPDLAHFGYAMPFPHMNPDHFTNYAGGVHADDSALRALLDAGTQVAKRLTAEDPKYHSLHQPVVQLGGNLGKGRGWRDYFVDPPGRAEAFEPFLGKEASPTQTDRFSAIDHVFKLFYDRPPNDTERLRYDGFLSANIDQNGPTAALQGLITAVIVSPEFVFRMEMGMSEPDEHGRRMLSPNELMYAIAYTLTDAGPDQQLLLAAEQGRLKTKTDVEREVRRILADDSIEKLPKLRFWQEFFGYLGVMEVFKEPETSRGAYFPELLVRDADQLVQYVMEQDKQVFEQLLTIDRFFVGWPTAGGNDELRKQWIEQAQKDAQDALELNIKRLKAKGKEATISPPSNHHKLTYSHDWLSSQGKMIMPMARANDRGHWSRNYAFVYGFDPDTIEWSDQQPMSIPDPRKGMLMHPAWLVAHSKNFDNDIVGRGHWIRERLFAGTMPSIPIDVEAQVPEDETKTLRQRMEVTREEYCWKCHKRMDPLGLPFESFDHFGWYRTEEITDAAGRRKLKQPVDSTGAIAFSGEPELDGPVKDARELVRKLADSERVRQSIVRHAFRFWMGRNEMLSDSPTLIAADKAYVDSDGSFNELIVSLLTSDSFLYRKEP